MTSTLCEGESTATAPDPGVEHLERFVATGDHEAFRQLVLCYRQMVEQTCRRILARKRAAEVEDVVQDTFIKLARLAGTVRTSLAAWLHTCARTTALNHLRSLGSRERREYAWASMLTAEVPPPEEPIEHAEQLQLVRRCLSELPVEERDLMLDYYHAGLTQQEIATRLGLSQAAIQGRIAAAVVTLRSRCLPAEKRRG